MKKIMCLLVFMAVASMAMAVVAPVTSVTYTDVPTTIPQRLLQSVTVGGNTFSTLKTGTTTQGTALVPRMDDLDLNTAFTGYGANVSKTVSFGGAGKIYFSDNGGKPDFFLFEACSTTGNPENSNVAAIFQDDTVGAWVNLPSNLTTTWGNTGLLLPANATVNPNQRIAGVSFDITDLKTAGTTPTNLPADAVIKGIAIGPTGIGLDPIGLFAAVRTPVKGEAHTPVPTDRNTQVDARTLTQISWSAPVDPNIVSVTGYDVWLETHEPNDVTDTRKSTNQPGQSYPVSLSSSTTYYWRVDTHVDWLTGPDSVVKGPVWKFTTLTPSLTFKNVITTVDLLPAALSATVAGNTSPVTSVVFELLTAGATLTDTTTDYQNPTATLTEAADGTYQVKLTVSGGTPTPLVKTVDVKVYADACAAKKASPGGWTANYYDRDNSCLVNVSDLLVYVTNWLNSTEMKVQETYAKTNVTVLDLDIQVECENAYRPGDPNYEAGQLAIGSDILASGGRLLPIFSTGSLQTYQVVVAETGAYTLHLRANHEWGRTAALYLVTDVSLDGNPANDTLTLLATVNMPGTNTAGNKWYQYSVSPVNLTAGTHLMRLSNAAQWNIGPDVFGFKKNF